MLQEITKTSGNVSNTRPMLLKRFNKAEADTDAVAGPSKRRNKEHRRKNQKRKQKNILKQARNLLFLFSKEKADKILPTDAKYHHVNSPDIKIEEQDLKALDYFMLLPSRHLKGLKFLLSIQAFNKDAPEQAESIAHILTERAVQEKERASPRSKFTMSVSSNPLQLVRKQCFTILVLPKMKIKPKPDFESDVNSNSDSDETDNSDDN